MTGDPRDGGGGGVRGDVTVSHTPSRPPVAGSSTSLGSDVQGEGRGGTAVRKRALLDHPASKVPFVEVVVDHEQLVPGAQAVLSHVFPDWDLSTTEWRECREGITNKCTRRASPLPLSPSLTVKCSKPRVRRAGTRRCSFVPMGKTRNALSIVIRSCVCVSCFPDGKQLTFIEPTDSG